MSESKIHEGYIDYIEMPARDFDTTETFYTTVFGWRFENWGEDYRAFNDGRLDGGFYKSDTRSDSDTGAVLVIFRTADLEAKLKTVIEAGGTIVKPIFSFPGGRRFHFADPNGNELAIWSTE